MPRTAIEGRAEATDRCELTSDGVQLAYNGTPWAVKYERRNWKISGVFADGEEFVAAYDQQLWEGFGAIFGVLVTAGAATAGSGGRDAWDDSRICVALARSGVGEKFDCAEIGGVAFVSKVSGARRGH